MTKFTARAASGQDKFKRDDFVDCVEAIIATKPYFHGGHAWTAMPQDILAGGAGVSVRTVQRWIERPPFVTYRKEVGGRPLCLIRIGEPDAPPPPHDPELLAKAMCKAWNKELRAIQKREADDLRAQGDPAEAEKLETRPPRLTSRSEYGCLIGLAQTWPPEHAVAIFSHVIRDWSGFMAGAKLAMSTMPQAEQKPARFYRYPTIRVVRRFPEVALDAWVQHVQDTDPALLGVLGYKLFAA